MKQIMPKAFNALTAVAQDRILGLRRFGPGIGLVHNTADLVSAILAETIDNDREYQNARTARMEASAAAALADKKLATFVMITREMLKPTLGARYSQAWSEVGFRSNNLAMPRTFGRRIGLCSSFGRFLAGHPELQVPGVATPEIAAQLAETAALRSADVNAALTLVRQKRAARDASVAALTARLRKVYRELKEFLTQDDSRWLEFGFNVPADKSVPAAPESVTVAQVAPDRVALRWKRPANAERIHVFQQIDGTDDKPVHVATITGETWSSGSLPLGAEVRWYLTALNAAGESMASEIVTFAVP